MSKEGAEEEEDEEEKRRGLEYRRRRSEERCFKPDWKQERYAVVYII
jgi:hypothetical protein